MSILCRIGLHRKSFAYTGRLVETCTRCGRVKHGPWDQIEAHDLKGRQMRRPKTRGQKRRFS